MPPGGEAERRSRIEQRANNRLCGDAEIGARQRRDAITGGIRTYQALAGEERGSTRW